MLITETKEILRQIALIDNRKLTEETLGAWHNIIGFMPFDVAQEALRLAQGDSSVKYLEPRHLVGWAKEAAFRLDRNKPPQTEQVESVPPPKCKHDKSLPLCLPCCRELANA